MVSPSWDSFSGPQKESSEPSSGQDLTVESFSSPEQQNEDRENVPNWEEFNSPSTYQGPPDPSADEETFDYFSRNFISSASRFAERLAGKYGDVEFFVKDHLSNLSEGKSFLGKGDNLIAQAIKGWIGKEHWDNLIWGRGNRDKTISPTSPDLQQLTEGISGEYTKPRSEGERKIQQVVGDIGSVTAPSGGIPLGRQAAVNNFVAPLAANVGEFITKGLGFGDDTAQKVKTGIWQALSLTNNVNGAQHASRMMNEGRAGIPVTTQFSVPRIETELARVERTLLSSDPATNLARQQIAAIRNDIASGQISTRSLMDTYDGINRAKRSRGLFELGRSDRAAATRNINEVRNVVKDEILNSGSMHPEALQSWQNGVQAWAVVHTSNALTNYVESLARGPYAKALTGPAAALFGVGAYGISKLPGFMQVGATTALPAAYKSGQVLYRVLNDRRMAAYYFRAIAEAEAQMAPAFMSNYNKLNKELGKSFSAEEKNKSKK
jgi:hypothetical protein